MYKVEPQYYQLACRNLYHPFYRVGLQSAKKCFEEREVLQYGDDNRQPAGSTGKEFLCQSEMCH